MFSTRLYVLAGIGVVVILALGWGGRTIYKAGYNAAVVEQKTDEQLIQAAATAAQSAAAQAISNIQVKHVTIRQKLEKELTRDVVYRDCVASPRVLELSNEAITGRPDPATNSVLPPTEPTR